MGVKKIRKQAIILIVALIAIALIVGIVFWINSSGTSTSPKVTAADPSNNSVNISVNKTIKITFNESIKSGSMFIELKNSNGTLFHINKSINGNILTINHSTPLSKGAKYTLILHTGSVTDSAGNKLAMWSSSFTTNTV